MRNASLDEFLSTSDEEPGEDEHTGESEADETDAEPSDSERSEPEADSEPERETDAEPVPDSEAEQEGPPSVDGVEPARSTFAWSPDGATCAACGERAEERWESPDGLVCIECKVW